MPLKVLNMEITFRLVSGATCRPIKVYDPPPALAHSEVGRMTVEE